MSGNKAKGPVLIEMDAQAAEGPDRAPPVPDLVDRPDGRAMRAVITRGAAGPSWLGRLFWALALGLMGAAVSVAAWDFAAGLITRVPVLGYAVAAMGVGLLLVAAMIGLREVAGFARLGRLDTLRRAAGVALAEGDLEAARAVVARLRAHYAARPELAWGLERLAERQAEQFDAEALLGLAEVEILAPLDVLALREVEGAARQVAMVTALVPLALADV
ncbi:MAG: TIGR01620 family protein, partial [Roseovarius sp.]